MSSSNTEESQRRTGSLIVDPLPLKRIKPERALLISRDDVLPRQLVEIRSEEDISDYVDNIRRQLLRFLEDVDVIKLK